MDPGPQYGARLAIKVGSQQELQNTKGRFRTRPLEKQAGRPVSDMVVVLLLFVMPRLHDPSRRAIPSTLRCTIRLDNRVDCDSRGRIMPHQPRLVLKSAAPWLRNEYISNGLVFHRD